MLDRRVFTSRNRQAVFYAALVLILAFAAFAAFFRLDAAGVNSWDEARHGVNAYEMMKTGNWIVNLYRYTPDYWNLKPPLSFWAIMLDFHLFGTTVLALRFYAALSMFATVLLVARFVYKRYGRVACLVAAALLACETILYRFHYGRSGDADALFGFLCTLCVLSLFWSQKDRRWLCLSGFSFALAFLDKSWHACILLAVSGLFLLLSGGLFHLGGRIWAGMLACAFGPIALWAGLRYAADGTAFFRGMIERDLLARSSRPLEGHGGNFLYYVNETLFQNSLGLLMLAALACLLLWLVFRRRRVSASTRTDALLFSLWIVIPFVFFSLAETKYSWYILPTVIPLSIVGGVACGYAWSRARSVVFRIVAVALSGVAVYVVAGNVYCTVSVVMSGTIPPIQQFLRGPVAKDVRGRTAYLEDTGDDDWQQNEIYVGEAYADLRCMDGGLAAFAKDPAGVAIVSTRLCSAQAATAGGLHVLVQRDGFLLLTHTGAAAPTRPGS